MAKLFANSEDTDQTPHSAASEFGLQCMPITLLQVSRLQWFNPFNPEFIKWTLPSLVLVISIVVNKVSFTQNH